MKKITLTLIAAFGTSLAVFAQDYSTTIFDEIVFYDGYAATYTEPAPPTGVVRLSNSLYATQLSDDQLDNMLDTFSMDVTIGALCDNYDRIGGVYLSLVPTGEAIDSENKQVIEIGRFITPFMDKNDMPDEVPYHYELDHLAGMFNDDAIRDNYDIWIEFNLFGVPYAANTQVAGCDGRSDVFRGTIVLNSSTDEANPAVNYTPRPMWHRNSMNNSNNSDQPGTAARMVYFTNDEAMQDVYVQLVTSAHGAGSGGEEYVRRNHFVYFDGEEVLMYKPGGLSCEPFRQYNTQANGIYGLNPRSDANWASWNNWCPGDVIPNRIIALGDVETGEHQFKLFVPDGQFNNSDDQIIISAFLYSADQVPLDNEDFTVIDYAIYPNPTTDFVRVEASEEINNIRIFNLLGELVLESNLSEVNVSELQTGSYVIELNFQNGLKSTEQLLKK